MLLPPPQGQSTLPHEFSLMVTRIPDGHLDMVVDGRPRSDYFTGRSVDNPLVAIMMTPRLSPQKILETKVYKTTSIPQIAVVIIRYKKGEQILKESSCSLIFGTITPAKRNTYRAACDYITRNFMNKLKQLADDTLKLNNGSDGDQHDGEYHDDDNMLDLPHVEGVPEGESSAIKDESFDSDEDIPRTHHSTLNQDDVNLLSPLLDIPTEDRKRQYDVGLANEVINTSKDRFHNAEGSPILTKVLKNN